MEIRYNKHILLCHNTHCIFVCNFSYTFMTISLVENDWLMYNYFDPNITTVDNILVKKITAVRFLARKGMYIKRFRVGV